TATVVALAADLAVALVASPTAVEVGQPVFYVATVTNHGPDRATGVGMGIGVPDGAQFVSVSSSQGTAPAQVFGLPGLYSARLGDLAAGASATVTLVVTPARVGT